MTRHCFFAGKGGAGETSLAYHRGLGRQSGRVTPDMQLVLSRLRDPEFTKVVLVAAPETMGTLSGHAQRREPNVSSFVS